MATQNSTAGKQTKSVESKTAEAKSVESKVEAVAPETAVAIDAVAEAPYAEPVAVEAKRVDAVAEPARSGTSAVAVAVAPAPVVVESVDAQGFSAAFDFDSTIWSKKYFELWAENAQAFLELAEQIAKAKTFDEAVALQSRFASGRFEAFLRQSKDVMTLAQRMTSMTVAPLCGTRAA